MVKAILESKLGKKIHKLIDKESKVLIKNSFWVFFANSYGAGLAFLKSILIARGLGVETLGAYAVIIAFVVTIQEIIKLNVGGTLHMCTYKDVLTSDPNSKLAHNFFNEDQM